MRRLVQHGGFAGLELAKGMIEADTKQLENDKTQLALVSTRLGQVSQFLGGVQDQAGWDLGLDLIAKNGGNIDGLPKVFSPQVRDQLAESTRTAQQRIEQGQKVIDQKIAQQTADTQQLLAQTGAKAEQRMSTEVIPTPMAEGGPATTRRFGGGTTQAPGQGMTLEQANARAGHEATLTGQFREQTRAYDEVREGLTLVRSAKEVDPVDPRASDQVLLNGFAKAVNGATNPRLATVLSPEKRDSLLGQLTQLRDALTKGASLSPQQRQAIVQATEELAAAQIANYNKIRDQYRTRAAGIPNVRPEVVAPEFVAPTALPAATTPGTPAATGAPTPGTGARATGAQPNGSIVVPRASLPALAKHFQISVAEMERRIRANGDTVSP